MPPPNGVGNEIPIVHKICEVYKLFHEYLILFPKYEKYALGIKIESTILEMLELSLSATHVGKDKRKTLMKLSNKIDFLKYLIRFTWEMKCINVKKYSILIKIIVEIGKMTGGWIKSQ